MADGHNCCSYSCCIWARCIRQIPPPWNLRGCKESRRLRQIPETKTVSSLFAASETQMPKSSWAPDRVGETSDYLMPVRRFALVDITRTQSLVRRPLIRLKRDNNPTEGPPAASTGDSFHISYFILFHKSFLAALQQVNCPNPEFKHAVRWLSMTLQCRWVVVGMACGAISCLHRPPPIFEVALCTFVLLGPIQDESKILKHEDFIHLETCIWGENRTIA